jgi:MarR family transcriptional regulator, transcriptional regulator for hemolysin
MDKKTTYKPRDAAIPFDQQQILGLAVNTLGRNILWSLAQRTSQHGLLPGVYPVIAWLMQLTDSTQGELARIIGIEQPTMAITLRRMERDGLIERSPDPDHGRRARVRLTQKGKKLSQVMRSAAYDVEEVASKGLSADEIKEFFRITGVMTRNLNAERFGQK